METTVATLNWLTSVISPNVPSVPFYYSNYAKFKLRQTFNALIQSNSLLWNRALYFR